MSERNPAGIPSIDLQWFAAGGEGAGSAEQGAPEGTKVAGSTFATGGSATPPAGDEGKAGESQPPEGGGQGAAEDKGEGAAGGEKSTPAELPKWTSAASKETRTDPRFAAWAAKHESFDAAVKKAMTLETEQAGMIRIPGPNATPEEKAAYAKAIGRPDKPEDYKLERQKGSTYDDAAVAEYQKLAHGLNLNQEQAAGFFKALEDRGAKAIADLNTQIREQRDTLERTFKKEWGGDYEQNVASIQRALSAYGDPDLIRAIDQSGIGNDARFNRFLLEVGKTVREDSAASSAARGKGERSAADVMYPTSTK